MTNSYIDGLVSPSRRKPLKSRSQALSGLEVGATQATRKHLAMKQASLIEKNKKQALKTRNIARAQSDDPLVSQAESRRRGLIREGQLNDPKKQKATLTRSTSGILTTRQKSSQQRSLRRNNTAIKNVTTEDDFVEPVRSFGSFHDEDSNNSKADFDGDFDDNDSLHDESDEDFRYAFGGDTINEFDNFFEDSSLRTARDNKIIEGSDTDVIELDSDDILGGKKRKNKQGRKNQDAYRNSGDEENRRDRDNKSKDGQQKKKGFFRRHLKLSIILIIFLIGGLTLYIYGDQLIAKLTGGRSGLIDLLKTAVTEKLTPLKMDKNGRTNIVIFGTSGYDMAGHEGRDIHDGAQLTDSLMIMSIDQNTKNAITVSIPRDLKVGREACYAGKINEIYTCASNEGRDEQAGATAVMNELAKIAGMEMHYYIHINWGSLVQIVNALGGITVTVNEDINDYYYTGIKMKAGVPTQLDGEKALGLARARHGSTGGDFTRGENQQRVLIGIKEKIALMKMDIPAMINLLNVLGDNLRTNVNTNEIKTAAHVFSDFKPENISSAPLTGLPDGDLMTTASYPAGGVNVSFVVPSAGVQNYTKIHKYLEAKIAEYSDSPNTSRILVLNGTERMGVAAEEKGNLEKAGFKVTGTDNAPNGNYTEKITLYSVRNKSQTREKLEKYYKVTSRSPEELPKEISTKDYDFVVIVGKNNEN